MPDPRARDPRFPNRPTHPDFIRLSEAVQNHDAMAEQLGVNPFEIVGMDPESLMYVIENRLSIFEQRLGKRLPIPKTTAMALYMDAFALGKRYAEMVQEGDDDTTTEGDSA